MPVPHPRSTAQTRAVGRAAEVRIDLDDCTFKTDQAFKTPPQAFCYGPADRKAVVLSYDSILSLRSIVSEAEAVSTEHPRVVELKLRRSLKAGAVTLSPATVERVLSCFPHLSTLHIDSILGQLPHLPHLRHVRLDSAADNTVASLAAQTQLESIILCQAPPGSVQRLFSTGYNAPALGLLAVPVVLDDSLLNLILQCTPALSRLAVSSLALSPDAASQQQWAVEHLALAMSMGKGGRSDSGAEAPATVGLRRLPAAQLLRLPRQRGKGVLTVTAPDHDLDFPEVTTAKGLSADITARLPTWRAEMRTVTVPLKAAMSSAARAAACFTTLDQIRTLAHPHPQLNIGGMVEPPEQSPNHQNPTTKQSPSQQKATRQSYPGQYRTKQDRTRRGRAQVVDPVVVDHALTDTELALLVQRGVAGEKHVSVDSLKLQSDEYSKAGWVWDTFIIMQPTSVVQLVRLLDAAARETRPTVTVPLIQLAFRDMNEVSADRIAQWFANVNLTHGITVELLSEDRAPASSLYWLRDVAAALQLDTQGASRASVELTSLDVNSLVIDTLHCLPQWGRDVVFNMCTFPMQPEAYICLAAQVPTTCKAWCFTVQPGDKSSFTEQNGVSVLVSICEGIDAHRGKQGLGQIRVLVVADQAGCAYARSMQQKWDRVHVLVKCIVYES